MREDGPAYANLDAVIGEGAVLDHNDTTVVEDGAPESSSSAACEKATYTVAFGALTIAAPKTAITAGATACSAAAAEPACSAIAKTPEISRVAAPTAAAIVSGTATLTAPHAT